MIEKIKIMEFSCHKNEGLPMFPDDNLQVHGIAADVMIINAPDNSDPYSLAEDIHLYIENRKIKLTIEDCVENYLKSCSVDIVMLRPYLLVRSKNPVIYHKIQTDINGFVEYFEGKELEYNPEIMVFLQSSGKRKSK